MAQARKLAAILAADIVGYSRLAGADEDLTLSRLRALRSDLIDPAIAAHNGRVVKRTGDGILIEFRSVVDAVRCAIEVQNGMVERNAGLPPERRIDFRIGIHLGDIVEESDGDLMGDGVNIAARLEGIAKPGAICLSEDAYRQVKSRLDLAVRDLGATQLKNIAEPVRVYSLEVGKAIPKKPTKSTAAKQQRIYALLGTGIVALIVIAVGAWYFLGANRVATVTSTAPAGFESAHQSIVVLPFTNLSGDPSQDYFVDAITDGVTTELSRNRYVFVIARNTAFNFKGKNIDAKQIGKELGVHSVLEGSVQRYQDRVHVNVQLIDADSGAHLWADQFDTTRADPLQAQNEIVARLAYTMGWEWVKAEAQRSARSNNPDAEDLALRCWAAASKGGFFGSEAEAGYRLCEQALDADPNNVDALTILPIKFYLPVMLHTSADPEADLKRADELASRLLALDPNYWAAHEAKGQVLRAAGHLNDAISEFEHALALNPNGVAALSALGMTYSDLGQYEKSIEFLDKALRLSPYDPSLVYWYFYKSRAYFALHQDDQAVEFARRSIASNQNYWPPHSILAAALALTGREAEARDEIQRLNALSPTKSIAAYKAAFAPPPSADPRVRARFDRFIEGLRKAGMPEE
jgi:adenylate cyclase